MVIIYIHPDATDWVDLRGELQASGLQLGTDFITPSQLCYRMVDKTASLVYTISPYIRAEYEAHNIEVKDI